MLERIRVDLEMVESLLFFWNLIIERSKVSEIFILTVAEMEQYQAVYDEKFDNISVRKVLSALSNREVFRSDNRRESRFWVDNLWMLEDPAWTEKQVAPLKRLNLDSLLPELREKRPEAPQTLNVVFVPFDRQRKYVLSGNSLYINFFAALPRKDDPRNRVEIGGKPLMDFIRDRLLDLTDPEGSPEIRPRTEGRLRNVFY
mgnify:CR=1 FL=1